MGYIAKDTDYWIHSSALTFTLNALDVANYIQCTVAGGAVIQCFIPDADEVGTLGYSASHGYKSWKLQAGPTAFNDNAAKYVYVAIPKDKDANTAMVVYPSEKLDINGRSVPTREDEEPQQIGNTNYYYIWLQGVISAVQNGRRSWNPPSGISTGKLDTAAGDAERSQSSIWYEYSAVADAVTLLKRLSMAATSWFTNIRLGSDKHNLTGVATALTADDFVDSDELVATPSYINANYLSKKNDDTVEGNITFQKDISVGGNALVNGILTVGNWLKAKWAELAYIKSPDYTGDGAGDTGFLLTNDYNGHSRLTVDELYVRMKAIFEELQVKKETVVGGNQIFSCASNIISFTRFIHVEEIGGKITETDVSFHKVKMPVKVKGLPAFISRLLQNTKIVSNILSKSEIRRKTYTDETEFNAAVQRVRCYFLAKEGENEIENWWVGDSTSGHDLAKCQTFNLTNKYRESYVTFGGNQSPNVYWWRKVVGVSSSPVEIEGKMYHWFDVAVSDCAQSSDIPAAGDHVSQFGNDTDPERMNLISIEINGSEAPSIKLYEGIYTYSITAGRYGNPMKARLSPKAGYRFSGSKFEIVTDYAIEPATIDRGNWLDIPVVNGVRICYYYDLVQHNGATWKCVASYQGSYQVDEAFTYDGHNYAVNDIIEQTTYNTLPVEQRQKCHRVQKGYTTDEPSETSPSWVIYAAKGEKGDKGDSVAYDPEHSSIGYAYSSMGTPEQGRDYPSDITTWSPTPPAPQKGKYLWTKDVTAYNNAGTIVYTTTYGVTYEPNDGESVEIDTNRTFIKYCKQSASQYTGQHPADDQFNTTFPSSLGQGDYLWVLNQLAYVGVTDPLKSYSVSMLGTDGSQGDPGADGYTTHFAYATSADGSQNFSTTNFSGATYIGTYRDQNADDSTDYHDYVWTRWKGENGSNGDTPIQLFKWSQTPLTAADKPTVTAAQWAQSDPYSGWYKQAQNRPSGDGYILYMSQNTLEGDGTIDSAAWSTPVQISGTDGKPGEDGTDFEYIYILKTSQYTFPNNEKPANITTDTSGTQRTAEYIASHDDFVPYGWNDNPQGIDSTNKFEYMSFRVKAKGSSTWGAFSEPIIWSHFGRNGMDGDGTEYVFIRTKNYIAPVMDSTQTGYESDDFRPTITAASQTASDTEQAQTTDNPKGTNETYKYEWVAKRNMTTPNSTTGERTWKKYTGENNNYEMTLWSTYAESNLIIDIDNEADQFGTDSDGVVIPAPQVRTTEVSLFYGTTAQVLNADDAQTPGVAAALFYEDDTAVPSTVAEVSCHRDTTDTTKGEVEVTIKSGTFPSAHTGIYAQITATCARGSRSVSFTLQQVKSGASGVAPDLCNLRPTSSSINFSKSELQGTTRKPLGCGYTKVTPSGTTNESVASSVVVNGTTYYVYWRYVGGSYSRFTTASAIYASGILPSTTQTGVEFCLSSALAASSITAANTLDYEKVPILKDGTDGTNGENAIRLDLDNEHEDFIYDDAGVNRTGNVTSQARLYDGSSVVGASSVNWYIDWDQSSGVPTSGANIPTCVSGLLTVKGITADTAKVMVKAEYPKSSGKYYYAEFTANKTNQDKYDLQLTPNSIPYNPATYPDNGVTITPSVRRTDLQGNVDTASISTTEAAGNLCLYYGLVNTDGTHGAMSLLTSATFNANGSTMERQGIYFELRKLIEYVNGAWVYRVCDFDTVPFPKSENGSNGENAIRLDLDNENDSMLYDGAGTLRSGSVQTTASLFDGNDDVSSQATFSIDSYSGMDSTQVSISGRTVTVSGMTNTDGYVNVKAVYKGSSYLQKFTLKKLVGTDKFDLVVSPNAVGVNTDNTVADTIINVQVYRTPANGGARHVVEWTKINNVYNAYGLTLSVKDSQNNNLQETTSGDPATTRTFNLTGSMATSADNVAIVLSKDSMTADSETVPVTHVHNGIDGTGASAVRIDLDNQMDSIPTDSDGKVLSQITIATAARIYNGASPVTSGVNVISIGSIAGIAGRVNGTTPPVQDVTDGLANVQWTIPANTVLAADKYSAGITLQLNNIPYFATFIAAVVKSGEPGVSPEIMSLLPSPDKVAFPVNSSGVIPSSVTRINLSIKRTLGNSTTTITVAESGLTVMYSMESMPSSTTPDSTHFAWPSSGVLVPSTATYGNVYIAAFDSNGNIVDKETVPVIKDGVKGVDGEDAEFYKIAFDSSTFAYDPNTHRNAIAIKGKVYKVIGNTTTLFTSLTSSMLSMSFIKADGTSRAVASGDIGLQNGEFYTYSGDGAESVNERTFVVVLTINSTEVARETMQIVKYGADGTGERGKMGRFFYYAQEWRDTEYPSYVVNDAQAPYFLYNGGYYVFNPEEPEYESYTMRQMGEPDVDDPNWQVMTSQFKYIITEALFVGYANLGSFIVNGDWLFSQYGMWGNNSTPKDEENGHTVTYWNVAGGQGNVEETAEAYTTINLEYPERTYEKIIDDEDTKLGTEIVYDPRALYHYQFNWEKYLVYSIRCKCDENCRLYLRDMSSNTDYALPMVRTYEAQGAYIWSLYIKVRNTGNYRIVAKHVDPEAADPRVQVDWMELYERSFRPNYAVDGKTGKTVQWKLYGNLTGEVSATRIGNSGETVLNGQTYIKHLQINAGGDLKMPSWIDGVQILNSSGYAEKQGYLKLQEIPGKTGEYYFKFVQQYP